MLGYEKRDGFLKSIKNHSKIDRFSHYNYLAFSGDEEAAPV